MTTTMSECNCCAEKYNKSTRYSIACPYCNYESCKSCYEKYLLIENNPHCMNRECDREWSRKFLTDKFTQKFINNDYKKHREEVLFQSERALLPATQPLLERTIFLEQLKDERKNINDKIKEYRVEIQKLQLRLADNFRTEREFQQHQNAPIQNEERSKFVRSCPVENCRGYLNSQWNCGICKIWACSKCHEVKGLNKDVEHTCNPDNVATAELLKKDTKPCPGCGTGIFKIDGCDQMWCVDCHTAFSWRTGRIENNIHNPHYYEWLRRNSANGQIPRNPGDVPGGHNQCRVLDNTVGRDISTVFGNISSDRITSKLTKFRDNAMKLVRGVIHLNLVEVGRFAYDYERNNQDLRIKYMRGQIDEDRFKVLIQQKNKQHDKNREIHNILTMFYGAASDIILRIHDDLMRQRQNCIREKKPVSLKMDVPNRLMEEIDVLRKYTNDCFLEISQTYKSKKYTIENFTTSHYDKQRERGNF